MSVDTPRYCEQCGATLKPTARFCGKCGRPIPILSTPTPSMPPPLPPQQVNRSTPDPMAPPPSEQVIAVVSGLVRHKGFMGISQDSFALAVTPMRLVFALITAQMMKDAVAQANQDAKSQGKGILGRIVAQIGWQSTVCQTFASMTPEAILSAQTENFAVANSQVKRVKFEHDLGNEDTSATDYVVVDTTSGKMKFEIKGTNPKEIKNLLRQTLGSVVS